MKLLSSAYVLLSVRFAPEPVYNTLNSLALLNYVEQLPGLNAWIKQTAASLTPEQRTTNRVIFNGLCSALTPTQEVSDFPSYLNFLREQDPYELRDLVLTHLSTYSRPQDKELPITEMLSDRETYQNRVQYAGLFHDIQAETYAMLNDPQAMHHLIVSHLEELWQTRFATEWQRVQRALTWQAEMFTRGITVQNLIIEDFPGGESGTRIDSLADEKTDAAAVVERFSHDSKVRFIQDTFRQMTGRIVPDDASLSEKLGNVKEVIFVPSWHTGRHVTFWKNENKPCLRLFFSEPPNYDITLLRSTPVGRGELQARLTALGDETRLHILELLVQHHEMHAQEIIDALELSQSSVSRHLKHLVSLGYLYERRGAGANKTYRLSSFYLARTAHALEQLISGEHVQHQPAAESLKETLPQELQRFLDIEGRVRMWPPARHIDKLLILDYLASFFERGHFYSEREVNELLLLHSTFRDAAALRRALYEYRFLDRQRDGSQYWLIGDEQRE